MMMTTIHLSLPSLVISPITASALAANSRYLRKCEGDEGSIAGCDGHCPLRWTYFADGEQLSQYLICVPIRSDERCSMTSVQQTIMVASGPGSVDVVPLLLTDGNGSLLADNPEQVMKELDSRATQLGAVLESILHEPHGEPRWGLNE